MAKNYLENVKKNSLRKNAGFNTSPADLVFQLLNKLSQKRSKDIIVKRFGLDGSKKKTLEEIGKEYGITRERVRQIEVSTLEELKKSEGIRHVKPLEESIESLLSEHGKLMEHNDLVNKSIEALKHEDAHGNLIEFILKLSDRFIDFKENKEVKKSWGLKGSDVKKAQKIISSAVKILEGEKKPFLEDKFTELISSHDDFEKEKELLSSKRALLSYLGLSKKILKNPYNEWGLTNWSEILPKGIREKAYIVLKRHGQPLHFREITNLINKKGFSQKKANTQTVHNELIKDPNFILIGRGIYALKEWGYKPGTVTDVISSILKENDQSLTKEEIIKEVLKQRIVKENTIILTLQNRNKFQKIAGRAYQLAE